MLSGKIVGILEQGFAVDSLGRVTSASSAMKSTTLSSNKGARISAWAWGLLA